MEAGAFYHVYNRGNNRQQVFYEEADYRSFLLRWKKYIHPVAETWAYTLLPNHFHVIVRIREGVEPKVRHRAFTNFFIAFARTMQMRHNHHGILFHRDYQRKQVPDDDALRWMIGYVLTNITHHNSQQDYRTHPHSSYRATLEEGTTLLERERLHQLFGSKADLQLYLQNQAAYYGLKSALEEFERDLPATSGLASPTNRE